MGVDIGGSHVGVGLVDNKTGRITHHHQCPIDGAEMQAEELIWVIDSEVRKLLNEAGVPLSEVKAIGMGCPGHIHKNILVAASNFPIMKKVPIADMVTKKLGIPSIIINDADAAMSAEVWGNRSR